ncbi:MAG TPA: glycosyltransferase family 39 protein [Solirubrobacterales bacterium]|nr:glycosyltransferase family 39 protein [Solirubrobacterales bacterium]
MKGLVVRNGGRVGLAALVALLLLGAGLRVDDAWKGRPPVYDAAAYATIAANLERGEGFTLGRGATQPASSYSPGLPLLAAGLYELSGGVHERLARVILALIGSLSVLFAYLIGRRFRGAGAGLVGAAAVAVYPALLEYQGMLMSEPLAATLLSGAVLSMLWAADGERRAKWLVPGLLLGALALTRPEYLALSFPIAVVVFARGGRDGWRLCLVQAAILVVGVFIVVAPWTLRNAIALDRFVPISSGGGQVLFAGTYLPAGADPERVGREVLERHPGLTRRLAVEYLPPRSPFVSHSATNSERVDAVVARVRLEQILAALAAQRYPNMESDAALARMGRERLWDEVSEQPLSYAGFVAAKIGRIWSHGPRDVMREPLWEALHWALVAFGLLGLVALARQRRWETLLIGVVLLSVTATGALLVASPRRVLVTIPLVAALAATGIVWAVTRLRERFQPL